jgi:hypothetical protein
MDKFVSCSAQCREPGGGLREALQEKNVVEHGREVRHALRT